MLAASCAPVWGILHLRTETAPDGGIRTHRNGLQLMGETMAHPQDP